MKHPVFALLAVALFAAAAVAADDPAPPPQHRIALFNGADFTGWKLFLPDKGADPFNTWSVRDGVIRCTGSPAGYLRTTETYSDYTLSFEWRWPADGGNSGVLIHVQDKDEVWPKSIEGQLQSGHAGDIWVIGGTTFTEHVNKDDRRVVKREESSEKPLGEWNQYKVVCKGDTIELYINGTLQNRATGCTVTSGFIGLQSEGTPIEFRNIHIEPMGK